MSKPKRVYRECEKECPARTEHEVLLDGSLRCTECGYNIEHAAESVPDSTGVCVLPDTGDVVEETP